MATMSESCKTCRFWYPHADSDRTFGDCCRFPPTPVPDDEAVFPGTHPDCWCGEYQPVSGVKPSPGLQWLIDNGKRPEFWPRNEDNYDRYIWHGMYPEDYETESDQSSVLPHSIFKEMVSRNLDPDFEGADEFASYDTAMLAAARAVESSQYLAMHPEPR